MKHNKSSFIIGSKSWSKDFAGSCWFRNYYYRFGKDKWGLWRSNFLQRSRSNSWQGDNYNSIWGGNY